MAVLLVSTILSFSPIAYGETTSVQKSIDAVKMEMKKAAMTKAGGFTSSLGVGLIS